MSCIPRILKTFLIVMFLLRLFDACIGILCLCSLAACMQRTWVYGLSKSNMHSWLNKVEFAPEVNCSRWANRTIWMAPEHPCWPHTTIFVMYYSIGITSIPVNFGPGTIQNNCVYLVHILAVFFHYLGCAYSSLLRSLYVEAKVSQCVHECIRSQPGPISHLLATSISLLNVKLTWHLDTEHLHPLLYFCYPEWALQ
jgi:hypothetical protein